MEKIVLVAVLTLKEHNKEEVFKALKTLHQKTHEEDEGCLQYDVHEDMEHKDTYVFIETWQNKALLDKHMKKEHFKAYREFINDKVEHASHRFLKHIL